MTKWLLLAASVSLCGPALAQIVPESATGPAAAPTGSPRTVEGATPERVAQVERCPGHKFEAMVEIDAVRKRSTRVRLCANPGSSDADWVKTLEAAIDQIEQRTMPAAAKDKVIAELRQEIAKFPSVAKAPAASGATFNLGASATDLLNAPTERFETSKLPPLPPPLPRKVAPTRGATAAATLSPPRPAMRFRIKCLDSGDRGEGRTCDFFEPGTVLVVSAIEGLEKGGMLRFRRRGETRGEVSLAPLARGQWVRVSLPKELCRGVSYTKIEIELVAAGSSGAAADRAGPFGLRC